MENVPVDKPVLFLSNHQNALMDVLLIATRVKRSPWFLTRSDVFKGGFLNSFFKFLQMIPIYRIRDGKSNLHKNMAVFDQCGELLQTNEAITLFPEANHSLKRKVRPLSKGFTRIVKNALEKDPDLDLQLVPIGQNYARPTQVGDSVALYFGKPIAVQEYVDSSDFVKELKQRVFENLTQLTTHIPETQYDEVMRKMGETGECYLYPEQANLWIAEGNFPQMTSLKRSFVPGILKSIFYLWNLPLVFLWRTLVKPKVPELEFQATFRFGFVLLIYPLFYASLMMILWNVYDANTAYLTVLGHAVVTVLLVKAGIVSASQRE